MARPLRPADAKPRRDEILDHATVLFAERGYDGVSMADLAERVGMRKASLFYHFATKDALYAAVLDRIIAAFGAAMMTAVTAEGSFEARLDTLSDTIVNVLAEQRYAARLLIREAMDWGPIMRDTLADRIATVSMGGVAFIRAGADAGVFVPLDAHQLMISLIGMQFLAFGIGGIIHRVVGVDVFDPGLVAIRRDEVRTQVRRLPLAMR